MYAIDVVRSIDCFWGKGLRMKANTPEHNDFDGCNGDNGALTYYLC